MESLKQAEWAQRLSEDEQAKIIDVRTDEEYEEKHIPNALQIDIYQAPKFMEEINQLDKGKNYYVYCKSGGRSSQACQIMEQVGIKNCYNLEGGIEAWEGETVEE